MKKIREKLFEPIVIPRKTKDDELVASMSWPPDFTKCDTATLVKDLGELHLRVKEAIEQAPKDFRVPQWEENVALLEAVILRLEHYSKHDKPVLGTDPNQQWITVSPGFNPFQFQAKGFGQATRSEWNEQLSEPKTMMETLLELRCHASLKVPSPEEVRYRLGNADFNKLTEEIHQHHVLKYHYKPTHTTEYNGVPIFLVADPAFAAITFRSGYENWTIKYMGGGNYHFSKE